MARPRITENKNRIIGFSIDDETLRMLDDLSKTLGFKSKSASLRYAVRKVYRIEVLGLKE